MQREIKAPPVPTEVYDDLDAYYSVRVNDWYRDGRDNQGNRIPSRSKQMRLMGWEELEWLCQGLNTQIRQMHERNQIKSLSGDRYPLFSTSETLMQQGSIVAKNGQNELAHTPHRN